MCDETVDDPLGALKLIPGWFVASKMIKQIFIGLYTEKRYSILMKILVMLHLTVME